MPRYIDADKLKERLLTISVVSDDLYGMGINRGLDRAETAIDMMPSADVVPKSLYENLLADVRENAIRDICEICKYHDEHPDCPADCMECDLTDKCHCHECLNCCGWVWRGEDTNVPTKVSSSEICVVCGEHVPEGRQICSMCETGQEFLNNKKG